MRLLMVMVLVILSMFTPPRVEAIVLDKCDIVRNLQTYKQINRSLLAAWTCVVMKESGGNTRKITTVGSNGSSKYGAFQLESGVWCEKRFEGGKCGVRCSDLLTDEIDLRNVGCAVKLFNENGFKGWPTYDTKCKNNLPSISECLQKTKTI